MSISSVIFGGEIFNLINTENQDQNTRGIIYDTESLMI